jgi:sulfite reductase (NADPH) flavoprotein alpha-component
MMAASPATAKGPLEDGDEGETPWHDQTLPMAERMKLAEGRSLRWRMMAAMAQQDCGQCGYNCEDYSSALFLKKEERLNLCVPGGKEAARMLKTLHAELGKSPAPITASPVATVADATAAPPSAPGRSRDHPAEAVFCCRDSGLGHGCRARLGDTGWRRTCGHGARFRHMRGSNL